MKPLVMLVRNDGPEVVVAYTATFAITSSGGQTERRNIQFKYPDAVFASSSGEAIFDHTGELQPGDERIVSLDADLPAGMDNEEMESYAAHLHGRATDVTSVNVSIDAVILRDGHLTGPDTTDLAKQFLAFYQAKKRLYEAISPNGAEQSPQVESALLSLKPPTLNPFGSDSSEAMYAVDAYSEARAWLRKYGESGLLRRAAVAKAAPDFKVNR
jgi:hypothetical protein